LEPEIIKRERIAEAQRRILITNEINKVAPPGIEKLREEAKTIEELRKDVVDLMAEMKEYEKEIKHSNPTRREIVIKRINDLQRRIASKEEKQAQYRIIETEHMNKYYFKSDVSKKNIKDNLEYIQLMEKQNLIEEKIKEFKDRLRPVSSEEYLAILMKEGNVDKKTAKEIQREEIERDITDYQDELENKDIIVEESYPERKNYVYQDAIEHAQIHGNNRRDSYQYILPKNWD